MHKRLKVFAAAIVPATRVGRLALALAGTALALVTTIAPASATTPSPFSAQAQRAGVTGTKAVELQRQVDHYVAEVHGRQIGANKIDMGGAVMIVAVPGETYARDLTTVTPAGTVYDCAYQHFCAYKYTNYSGTLIDMYSCGSYTIPWYTTGSWNNHQTTNRTAGMYLTSGGLYVTPGAWFAASSGDWSVVDHVNNCYGWA